MCPTLAVLVASILFSLCQAYNTDLTAKSCGKYYHIGNPMDTTSIPHGFPYPELSETPLLDFQCATKSSFYLDDDDQYDPPLMIIDANITNDIGTPYHGVAGILSVAVKLGDQIVANGTITAGSMGNLLPLSLDGVAAQSQHYNLSCEAHGAGIDVTSSANLAYLPTPPFGGCGSKVDRLSGTIMVRNSTAGELQWHKFYPVGFFDETAWNSTNNPAFSPLDRLSQAHESGMNLIHVRAPFPTDELLGEYLDEVDRLGMYFVFDFSSDWMNLSYVQGYAEMLRGRPNLIGWYAGDEPDGGDKNDTAPAAVYKALYEWDGYHPVSTTLNCNNYKYIEYGINGADQIRVDPYPVNVAAAFSRNYGTPVTPYFGVSGCDGCLGSMYDTINRIEASIDRCRLSGVYRTKQTWAVPQSFDDHMDTSWDAPPTGADVALQMVVALNHGASGLTPYDAPGATGPMVSNASVIAKAINDHPGFFTEHADSRQILNTSLPFPGINNLDVASWTNDSMTLVTAANFFLHDTSFTLLQDADIVEVVFGNVTTANGTAFFTMPKKSVAAALIRWT